jgi:glycosyltransferase involved in cell wall biosynthesis
VVDDGSTDDTAERVAAFGESVRYVARPNAGASAARNLGIASTRGEFVAFLDADDVWHPRKLEAQLEALARHPDLGMLSAGTFDWPASGFAGLPDDPAGEVVRVPWQRILIQSCLHTSANVVRRSLLERVGGFDTALQCTEDRDLWLRVAELAPVAYLPLPLVGVRQVDGSLSRRARGVETNMVSMLRKIDARRAWQGGPFLRRKAYSRAYYSSAYVRDAAGDHAGALVGAVRSLAWFPLPYASDEVRMRWARPRCLAVYVLRMLGLKGPEREPSPRLAATTCGE